MQPCCRRSLARDQEVLVFETSYGQQITLQNSPAAVLIVDGNGNTVRLDAAGITITSAVKLAISAAQIEIAAGQITVNAPLTTFSGMVQAETVTAASIVPGAGNIW